ncbi:MAG TPA: phage protein [Acidimicrobiales bacterium]|nr:phage protein [Acidimicrobiales bacterium]
MSGVYSFLDVVASLSGPGGTVDLAAGAGAAEEGITIEPTEDKNIMTIGAGGEGMHSLVAGEASTVTVRLLKTSPVNAQLQTMYNAQTQSSLLHGRNSITVRNLAGGDLVNLARVAFARRPTVTYAKEGGMMEWTFHAVKTSQNLGRYA